MRAGPARAVCALTLAAALLSMSGCMGTDDGDGQLPGGSGNSSGGVNDVDPAVRTLVAVTEAALEEYWAGAFSSISSAPFVPPAATAIYTHDETPTDSACLEADDPIWINNSYYCAADREIYLDADLLPGLGDDFAKPDVATVLVLAHEFGHHLEALGGAEPEPGVGLELEADCLAGVFLSAVAAGRTALDLGDWTAFDALDSIRELTETEWNWLDPRVHGGLADRAQAVATGYLAEDARSCSGYDSGGPTRPVEVGPYSFRPPPTADVHELESGGYRATVDGQPKVYQDVRSWSSLGSEATDALAQVAPIQFEGSEVQWVGMVQPFDHLTDFSAANLRYSQVLDGQAYYGVLLLATVRDGTGVLVDTYQQGSAPAADDEIGWRGLGNYAFSTLWGITG